MKLTGYFCSLRGSWTTTQTRDITKMEYKHLSFQLYWHTENKNYARDDPQTVSTTGAMLDEAQE